MILCFESRHTAEANYGLHTSVAIMVHAIDRPSYRFGVFDLRTSVCPGPIPEELGELNKLEELRLDDNKLTGEVFVLSRFGVQLVWDQMFARHVILFQRTDDERVVGSIGGS